MHKRTEHFEKKKTSHRYAHFRFTNKSSSWDSYREEPIITVQAEVTYGPPRCDWAELKVWIHFTGVWRIHPVWLHMFVHCTISDESVETETEHFFFFQRFNLCLCVHSYHNHNGWFTSINWCLSHDQKANVYHTAFRKQTWNEMQP